MSKITISAKTVEEAITEACVQLGVTSTGIEYEVIEKGSAGFLGIGAKQAVISAWEKKEEKQEKKPGKNKTEIKKEDLEEKKEEEVAKETTKKETTNRENVKKEESLKNAPQVREIKLAKVEQKTIEATEKFLKEVMDAMELDVTITSRVDEEGALAVTMDGDNMGILIGKRGQTLDALQYLANRVANKSQEGYVRVKLDTENYRKRRKDTLENFARNTAQKVKRTRRPVSLEPMNPYERRIIHSALQHDKYVTTYSEGEEPYRRVVVTLK